METPCREEYLSVCRRLRPLLLILAVTLLLLPPLPGESRGGEVTLTWNPPLNADGSPFTGISGYRLHLGRGSGSYSASIDVGSATTYSLSNLTDGVTYYFAVTDYDSAGNESGYSNEVSRSLAPSSLPTGASGLPVMLLESGRGYPLVMDAYSDPATRSGDTIMAQAGALTEVLRLARPLEITLRGGYDEAYVSTSGLTLLQGVVVENGALTVDGLCIR